VMLEKPAGVSLDEHRKLIETAREKKLHVQMIYLFRYMSAVREMLARAKQNEFGRVYEFRARLPKAWPTTSTTSGRPRATKAGSTRDGGPRHRHDGLILGKPAAQTPSSPITTRPSRRFRGQRHRRLTFDQAWASSKSPRWRSPPPAAHGSTAPRRLRDPHPGSGHRQQNIQPVEVSLQRRAWGGWLPARRRSPTSGVRGGGLRRGAGLSMDHDLRSTRCAPAE
jgi:hypothetical protein